MAIKLKLADFDEGHYEAEFDVAPEDIGLNAEHDPMRVVGPIHVRLDAKLTPEEDVIIHAPLRASFTQQCVRCLDDVPSDFEDELYMLFSPRTRWREEASDESGEMPDPDSAYYDGDEIDLEEEISGFLLQNCEEYPLCRADCKGLDVRTGVNLNHETPPPLTDEEKAASEPEWKRKLRDIAGDA